LHGAEFRADLAVNRVSHSRETVVVSAVVAYRLLQKDRKTAAAQAAF
jgi:hypothetical protein